MTLAWTRARDCPNRGCMEPGFQCMSVPGLEQTRRVARRDGTCRPVRTSARAPMRAFVPKKVVARSLFVPYERVGSNKMCSPRTDLIVACASPEDDSSVTERLKYAFSDVFRRFGRGQSKTMSRIEGKVGTDAETDSRAEDSSEDDDPWYSALQSSSIGQLINFSKLEKSLPSLDSAKGQLEALQFLEEVQKALSGSDEDQSGEEGKSGGESDTEGTAGQNWDLLGQVKALLSFARGSDGEPAEEGENSTARLSAGARAFLSEKLGIPDLASQEKSVEEMKMELSSLLKSESKTEKSDFSSMIQASISEVQSLLDDGLRATFAMDASKSSEEKEEFLEIAYQQYLRSIGWADEQIQVKPPSTDETFEPMHLPIWAAYAFDAYLDPVGGFWQRLVTGSRVNFTSSSLVSKTFEALLHIDVDGIKLGTGKKISSPSNMKIVMQQGEMLQTDITLTDKGATMRPIFLYVQSVREPLVIEIFREASMMDGRKLYGSARLDVSQLVDKHSAGDNTWHEMKCIVKDAENPDKDEITLDVRITGFCLKSAQGAEEHIQEKSDNEQMSKQEAQLLIDSLSAAELLDLEDVSWDALADLVGMHHFAPRRAERLLFLDNEEYDTQLRIWAVRDQKFLIVAFRGTEQNQWKDFVTDSLVGLQPFVSGQEDVNLDFNFDDYQNRVAEQSCVHYGFLRAYASVRQELRACVASYFKVTGEDMSRWTICSLGHSLGGALATLFAGDAACWFSEPGARVIMRNFGSPKVGNLKYVIDYNERVPSSFRVVNETDVIARMPRGKFHHVGYTCLVSKDGNVWVDDFKGEDPTMSRFSKSFAEMIESERNMMQSLLQGKSLNDHFEVAYFQTAMNLVPRSAVA
ncbi:Lipase [Porphyridium purpureum]|uniref:Lipase n=1 Tax=Porphyridium purpureum TaxID=35688 RepID=A0A5J4YUL6_PORPP|nr:Lipase [Porphyridium purpureum]|eukprot:POR5972..scf227_4